jgi:hypothetical protein
MFVSPARFDSASTLGRVVVSAAAKAPIQNAHRAAAAEGPEYSVLEGLLHRLRLLQLKGMPYHGQLSRLLQHWCRVS